MPPTYNEEKYHALNTIIANFNEHIPDGVVPTPLTQYCADIGSPNPDDESSQVQFINEAIAICVSTLQLTADSRPGAASIEWHSSWDSRQIT